MRAAEERDKKDQAVKERKWARVDEGEKMREEEQRLMPVWFGEREGEQLVHKEKLRHRDVSGWRN